MHRAIECVFESESKVGSNKRDQGKSETQEDRTTRRLLEQAQRFAQKTGIRLLPSSDFRFTKNNRENLAGHLKKYTHGINPLLDTVEELARDYRSHLCQQKSTITPADLKEELQAIKKHAVSILKNFSRLGVLTDDYSASSECTISLICLEADNHTSDSRSILQQAIGDLVILIQAIDSATCGDTEPLECERAHMSGNHSLISSHPETPYRLKAVKL